MSFASLVILLHAVLKQWQRNRVFREGGAGDAANSEGFASW